MASGVDKVGEPGHRAAVDRWMARSIGDASTAEIVGRFGVAFEALWTCAVTTLGSVTLTAIAERVLTTATGRYPFLAAINPRPHGDARWRQHLHERLATVPRPELIAGLHHGLIELLTVIGRLTAEILTQELHAAMQDSTASASEPRTTHAHPAPGVGIGS